MNDYAQYIEVDLGKQFNISAIGTQGRQQTMDFVQEFKLESGIDGHDYNTYRDRNGNVKVRFPFLFYPSYLISFHSLVNFKSP